MHKSPAQVLFDQVYRTWIAPARAERESPMMSLCLIIWPEVEEPPEVYFDERVREFGVSANVRVLRDVTDGERLRSADIGSVSDVQVAPRFRNFGVLFLMAGAENRYFIGVRNCSRTPLESRLRRPGLLDEFSTEGVDVTDVDTDVDLWMDFVPNSRLNRTPAEKRRVTMNERKRRLKVDESTVAKRVRRHFSLKAVVIFHDADIASLLHETRECFIAGYNFAAIAGAATTADRICLKLMRKYPIPARTLSHQVNAGTLGERGPFLRARHLITRECEATLLELNRIRNKHVHASSPLSERVRTRDARRAVHLLQEFIDATVSVFSDYEIEAGRLVPKRLV